jgi:hypothetical protein
VETKYFYITTYLNNKNRGDFLKSRKSLGSSKKILIGLALLFSLMLFISPSIGQPNQKEITSDSEPTKVAINPDTRATSTRQGTQTHTVFAEDFTAEWCQYCPTASENLLSIYNSHDYDFYFVCMILEDDNYTDISDDAQARADEYNYQGIPTVEFDGGYYEVTGNQSDETAYREAIETCGDRQVPNVDLEVTAENSGGAVIDISVGIINNGDSSYSGILRVYVVEIVSRYLDYDGNRYPYGFLDFAIESNVNVPSGQSETESASWDGAEVSDGLGNDFGDIDPNNMVVFAVLFNGDTAKPWERIPESSKTLDLHWVDEAAAAYLSDKPPDDTNEPVVTIKSPQEYDEIFDTIRISASVEDDGDIQTIESLIRDEDGYGEWLPMYGPYVEDEYFRMWDTTEFNDGDYTIIVRAIDRGNNRGEDSIEVSVKNDLEYPEVTFKDVKDGQKISDTFNLRVIATDDTQIKNVRCRVDANPWVDMDFKGSSEYSLEIETTELSDGEHTITIEVEDKEGKVTTESIKVQVQNKESSEAPGSGTPGFEVIVLICAISILVIFYSKIFDFKKR